MSVPDGFTWSSESGVFLVPEASAMLGGVAMWLALAVLRGKR